MKRTADQIDAQYLGPEKRMRLEQLPYDPHYPTPDLTMPSDEIYDASHPGALGSTSLQTKADKDQASAFIISYNAIPFERLSPGLYVSLIRRVL